MIVPSIGRVVWYYPRATHGDGEQPNVMLIAYVWNDRLVNLGGFDKNGQPMAATSVPLMQDDDVPTSAHAMWMPYQVGQAKKHEAEAAPA